MHGEHDDEVHRYQSNHRGQSECGLGLAEKKYQRSHPLQPKCRPSQYFEAIRPVNESLADGGRIKII